MSKEIFTGNFTQQAALPEAALEAAMRVMQSGRLHRYNTAPGEMSEVAALEQEFASYMGARYALAVTSGGYALATALRALGVGPGDKVLTNAFTLAPVPGAIASVGAMPVFVEVTEDLVIDLDDLAAKAGAADVLMLSHMRGHIVDMDALMALCAARGIRVIEDCAHTMGAKWNGIMSGRHGVIAAYSTQSYKHLNSGEGGLLITDDEALAAKMTLLSGSYMLYDRHGAGPAEDAFEAVKYDMPNISGRMDNLRAALLRPQLAALEESCAGWNARYRVVEEGLRDVQGLRLIARPEAEDYVMSSFQFLLLDWAAERVQEVVRRCAARGVELKWFGAPEPSGFTSRYDSWRYAGAAPMPKSDRVLAGLLDLRLPLSFGLEDCALIARIIRDEVGAVFQAGG
ncbi:MAG: DegT/DnrJ/EryC1/StrS family aminotransferase [Maritimibacter sp.]